MFLLYIYIILTPTTRKGSHRNKIEINVAVYIPKKHKEGKEENKRTSQGESDKLHNVISSFDWVWASKFQRHGRGWRKLVTP